MNILLDTHFLLWALLAPENISHHVQKILTNQTNTIFFSTLSLWEIEIKHLKRPEQMPASARQIYELCQQAGFEHLPIEILHILALSLLSRVEGARRHNDPFDRLLLAQAKSSDMILLTHDELLLDYNESCVHYM